MQRGKCLKAHLGMVLINSAPKIVGCPHVACATYTCTLLLQVRKKVAREASDVNKLGVKLPKSALYNKVGTGGGKGRGRGRRKWVVPSRLGEREEGVVDLVYLAGWMGGGCYSLWSTRNGT